MHPTAQEVAAMAAEERRTAVAAMDVNALSADEQRELIAAVMAPSPTPPRSDVLPHIRQRAVLKRGNGFYRPTYGPSENGSRTLCGAEAGLDYTWAEARSLRDEPVCEQCQAIRAGQAHIGARP
jgi:hypothetical protein